MQSRRHVDWLPPSNPRELPNGDCLPAGVKTWDSGTILNRNGKRFMLYLMPPASGFSYSTSGAQRYQAVCQAAGLRTVGNGYSSYANNCQRYNCMPVGCHNSCPGSTYGKIERSQQDLYWGSSGDMADNLAKNTGWDVQLMVHYYSNAYPYVKSVGTSLQSYANYYPVCGRELD